MWRAAEGRGRGAMMPTADTAVILCGGESRRAGLDKQLLPCEGTTLPRAIARRLEALFREIIIVTHTPHIYADASFTVVEDIVKGAGPLGGIFTGLRHCTSHYSYVIAGDMPETNLAYIEWMRRTMLRESLESGDVDAVAARQGVDHLEPFNSFFSVRCAPVIEASLARGEGSIGRFLKRCDHALLVQEEVARFFSPDWSMFRSVNTRADVDEFLRRGYAFAP